MRANPAMTKWYPKGMGTPGPGITPRSSVRICR
jgi:hypothetical protein